MKKHKENVWSAIEVGRLGKPISMIGTYKLPRITKRNGELMWVYAKGVYKFDVEVSGETLGKLTKKMSQGMKGKDFLRLIIERYANGEIK